MLDKIKTLFEISEIVRCDKEQNLTVAHCHGVFDLLHPGHIKHLQEAKKQADKLVVSITPDRFVNKGPGRPAFPEQLRLEQLAALGCIDYVVLNDSPDAVSIIKKIQPSVYVKGDEYKDHGADVTGKISDEAQAVSECGGEIYYTSGIVFSSSSLINRFFDVDSTRIRPFIDQLTARFTLEEVLKKIAALSDLRVLVVGDAIIDEYHYVHPLGQSGKGLHMTARCLEKEIFLGGALIIANHLSQFAGHVTLLSAIGAQCPFRDFIVSNLHQKVVPEFCLIEELPTLTKRRYVIKDGETLSKLFETYSSNDLLLDKSQTEKTIQFIHDRADDFDLVLVCDFGNGFTNAPIIHALSDTRAFLALNTQTNSGNRGFNVVTHYRRADFISVNEPELRFATQDKYSSLEMLASDIMQLLGCRGISVTRGVNGIQYYSTEEAVTIPAITMHAIDRVGAGDSYFSVASLCAASGYPPILAGFLGSVAAAMSVQMIGNKEAINKVAFCKYVTRLLK